MAIGQGEQLHQPARLTQPPGSGVNSPIADKHLEAAKQVNDQLGRIDVLSGSQRQLPTPSVFRGGGALLLPDTPPYTNKEGDKLLPPQSDGKVMQRKGSIPSMCLYYTGLLSFVNHSEATATSSRTNP